MSKYSDINSQTKEILKANLTAENTDFITQLSTKLDELENENKAVEEENLKLKDKIVECVKSTTFKDKPNEDLHNEPKSIDEALDDAFKKYVK